MAKVKKKISEKALVRSRTSGPDLSLLTKWFRRSARVLPWREDPSPYRVWISEIMLQQTQVITVKPYFDRFIERFPTVEALSQSDLDSVYESWAGLGYYSRARNVHKAAKEIVKLGGYPSTREGWLEIPGVGPYTAGAILSIAFGKPEALVDGNVERVFSRLFRISRSRLGEKNYKEEMWTHARRMVSDAYASKLRPSDLNQAWMELGATLCTPKNPKCESCPIQNGCQAFKASEVSNYPEKKKRAAKVQVKEKRHAWILSSGKKSQVLFSRIPEGEWRAGLWDLPTIRPKSGKKIGTIQTKHVVTNHEILRTTEVWVVVSSQFGKSGEWDSFDAPKLPLGSAPKKVLQAIREKFF